MGSVTGRDLRLLRLQYELRQRDVAEAMGVSRSRVRAIEYGRPTMQAAQRYIEAVLARASAG